MKNLSVVRMVTSAVLLWLVCGSFAEAQLTPVSYGMPEVDIYGFANLGLQYGAGDRVATSYQIADSCRTRL